jgi:hypothetical protein
MGSAWTCGCRGGVIVPLRPNVRVETDHCRVDGAETAAKAKRELSAGPQQLSLFEEPPER